MTVNVNKIRLGSVDAQYLDQGLSTQIDLGASSGGAMFTYKPTYASIDIDQALPSVQAFRIKEELTYETTLVQSQALLFVAAMSQNNSLVVSTVGTTLAAPAAPVITKVGAAGAVTCTYSVIAYNYNGDSIPSATGTLATCNTTQSVTNYNVITWTAVAGAIGYKVQRTVGGVTQGLLVTANPLLAGTLFLNDTGLVATAYVASVAAPVAPSTDVVTVGNAVNVPIRTLDVAQPKNDGTNNHWLYHVNRCYSSDPLTIDLKRDKNTEYKAKLTGLGDPNSAFSLLQITEQY